MARHQLRAATMRRHRIHPMATPRMAAAKAPGREPGARHGAVFADGLERVLGTSGLEPATEPSRAKNRRQHRRDPPLIESYQAVKYGLRWIHGSGHGRGREQAASLKRRQIVPFHPTLGFAGDRRTSHQDQIHRLR